MAGKHIRASPVSIGLIKKAFFPSSLNGLREDTQAGGFRLSSGSQCRGSLLTGCLPWLNRSIQDVSSDSRTGTLCLLPLARESNSAKSQHHRLPSGELKENSSGLSSGGFAKYETVLVWNKRQRERQREMERKGQKERKEKTAQIQPGTKTSSSYRQVSAKPSLCPHRIHHLFHVVFRPP